MAQVLLFVIYVLNHINVVHRSSQVSNLELLVCGANHPLCFFQVLLKECILHCFDGFSFNLEVFRPCLSFRPVQSEV